MLVGPKEIEIILLNIDQHGNIFKYFKEKHLKPFFIIIIMK